MKKGTISIKYLEEKVLGCANLRYPSETKKAHCACSLTSILPISGFQIFHYNFIILPKLSLFQVDLLTLHPVSDPNRIGDDIPIST